ncbi:uncharacterized protein LOC123295159 [Chrysoperla carnea]|uniref:uncharacterized protein LOC123295159 n=1 Tax=Chrysoperla carnea TaxID=189513 RepID=UPI001D0736EF|nr:uncharacterized protein LOC123295159 [Chrysoperla carnea]
MTDLLASRTTRSRGDTFPRSGLLDGCRSGSTTSVSRLCRPSEQLNAELKHSKSDDLVLQVQQSNDLVQTSSDEMQRVYSDEIPDIVHSDSEPEGDFLDRDNSSNNHVNVVKSLKKPNKHELNYDFVDPEDSIRDMITENDFYRFVLFKKHYEKYIQLSQKYEEARNMAYYLEEKYHEIKAERDELAVSKTELENRLKNCQTDLLDKESELFAQLERVVRLEEDCEKLRGEKQKLIEWKDKLEKEKNEAYRQLQIQAKEADAMRNGLERARLEVVRQMTTISQQKDVLERENEKLKETLQAERKGVGHYLSGLNTQKKRISQNIEGLEKEVSELKLVARQSASLSSQFKKGMRHIATCRRRKCSVCAYTRATFGAVGPNDDQSVNEKKLHSCLHGPIQEIRNWMKPSATMTSSHMMQPDEIESLSACSAYFPTSSPLASTRTSASEYSMRMSRGCSSPSPCPSFQIADLALTYIDEATSDASSDSGNIDEYNLLDGPSITTQTTIIRPRPTNTSRAFSSDSGFSSELYTESKNRSGTTASNKPEKYVLDEADTIRLQRSKWTASFRKLIHKVAKKQSDG